MKKIECEQVIDSQKNKQNKNIGYIQLPISKDDFTEFITSLLGKPQSIEGQINGIFDIHRESIEEIHYLLCQRMKQQNKSKLIQFTAKIMYNDNSSVLLGSFDEFQTYKELRPVVSEAIYITWTYLVQFEDRNVPEKQDIELSIDTIGHRSFKAEKRQINVENGIIRIKGDSNINYSIKHTARTWAVDIEALLINHIKQLIIDPSPIKQFLQKHSSLVGIITGCFVFICSIYGSYKAYMQYSRNSVEAVKNELYSISGNINDEISFIANYIAKGEWSRFTSFCSVFLIIAAIISIIICFMVESNLDIYTSSFLNLTDESLKYRKKQKKRQSKEWVKSWLSIAVSIFCGILANYIYKILEK